MQSSIALVLVGIIALGVSAQWIAWRTHIPAIILLLVTGLLVGPVFGLFHPSAVFGAALQPIISLCVAVILFEGGLSLELHELKEAAKGVRRLVYLGVPIAWTLGALAAHFIAGLSWPVSLLIGAILVVTGPTVIMPLLRQAGLQKRTASYLKWEGILVDPIGALIAVLVFQFFAQTDSGGGLVAGIGWALLSAGLLGGLGGYLAAKAFQHGLVPEYLKSPVLLTLVLLVYVISNALQHEGGLLAVTIMGVVVGNMRIAGIEDMKRFKEYITVMLVSVVFILLTADLEHSVIHSLDWRGIAFIAAVLFLVRPISILLATQGIGMNWRDRVLLGWIAPRGIVAAATAGVFGPAMVAHGYADASALLPIVFGVIFATVALHGLTIRWLARRLGLAHEQRKGVMIVGASPWAIELGQTLQGLDIPVFIVDSSWHSLRPARLAGLPVFYGEILSDFADESVDAAGIGTVLALTSNDAYNALVCNAMGPELGRAHVYQLPMGTSEEDDPKAVTRSLRGRIAFTNDAVYERMWRNQVRGWTFYKTRLTESYSYSDFLGDVSNESIQILSLKADGRIQVFTPERSVEPESGDTIVYFAPMRETEREPAEEKPRMKLTELPQPAK